jgi:diadenosine tetraphosphatase ApaH/serine/threonine PP2A family protein phosphatase
MRYLLISDIHANLVAFEAVLKAAKDAWDEVLFLGDLVGYGPNPNECVATMQQLPHTALSGNHDWAALGRIDISTFNSNARMAMEWTQTVLSDNTRNYLDELPSRLDTELFTYVHASPRSPVWEYVSDIDVATENFGEFKTTICFFGHTHVPIVYIKRDDGKVIWRAPDYNAPFDLSGSERMLINPGSVGQPRDADPRAAYAIIDTDAMTFQQFRVEYDIEETQSRMVTLQLPPQLVARLQYGW